MNNSILKELRFKNERVLEYQHNSPERLELKAELARLKESFMDIPIVINGEEIRTGNTDKCIVPHNHDMVLGQYHLAGKEEIGKAIQSALKAKKAWGNLHWNHRASIFLKAAELAAGPWRAKLNAATMLSQSKTYKQAEIDSACEMIDFLRFNAIVLHDIYSEQPLSTKTYKNRMEYRPLEGFVFAVSPFNFTSIAGNLVGAPVVTGNTVLWKPASTSVYSSYVVYQLFKEAGVPDGVINFIPSKSSDIGETILGNENLSGLHFTGSTEVFQNMWQTIGNNIYKYKTFPRLVGETGGKNYIIAHPSAHVEPLSKSLTEGAFEYQGQKCSAVSRAYIPKSLWLSVKENLIEMASKIKGKMGNIERRSTFMGSVIDRKSFNNIKSYIEFAKNSNEAEIIFGGSCDDSTGYFIEPTVVLTTNPNFKTMEEEIFGPVLTIYLYEDEKFKEVLHLCANTSKYGLTGSIFATDRYAIVEAEKALLHTAGNFYINDKPTGAVVGQQPFGGSRLSGTNDKAGSKFNLIRWMSPRIIKENLIN